VVIHAKGDSADIARRFTDLVEYTKFHFATEHQFMERYRFPGKKAHDLAHGRLLMDISHFNAMLHRGGDLFVLQSIKDWLLHHIQAEDKKLGEFLSRQALA
jgi:hemerythrin-like metal-binding protein